jgi:hypothetical protein
MNAVVSIPAACLPNLLLQGSPVLWDEDFGIVDLIGPDGRIWVWWEDRDITVNPVTADLLRLLLRDGVTYPSGVAAASLALARKLGATDAYAALWEQYECGGVQQANLTAIGPSGRQVYRFSDLVPDPIEALAGVCREG